MNERDYGPMQGGERQAVRAIEETTGLIDRNLVDWVRGRVTDAVATVRQDPSLRNPDARKAALTLLAFIAGGLLVLNAILMGGRRRR